MGLPKLTVQNPVTTAMVFIALVIFGVISWISLPRDLMPDIELPAITVITIYPGASAEDVESQVTNPLEVVLSGTENLKKLSSSSRENVSFISMQFDWGTDVSDAVNSARDLMELAKSKLPVDAMSPYILKINSSMIPVVVYTIQADISYNGLEKIAYEQIIDPLKKVPGVGSAFIIGQPSREISINVDPVKLKAYNLNITQIATILQAENITIPGGNVRFDKYDFAVRIPGEVKNTQDIGEIAITSFNNRIIRMKDIAEITDGYREKDEKAYSDGKTAVGLFIQKQTDANTYEVYTAIVEEMAGIQKNLPADVKTNIVFNTAEIIKEVTSNLSSTIWYAGLFVLIVVLIFLREWRNSLIIILSIPVSMVFAFITMKLLGYTMNIFSLISLIVAIGMVVDNSIVVLENINKHIENGARPKQAAIFATGEMGNAITASTLTTICVFIPLMFTGGLVGVLFKQLAILVSVTMAASLLTALTLTPMLSSLLLKNQAQHRQKRSRLFRSSENIFNSIENGYRSSLKYVVRFKYLFISFALLLFLLTIFIFTRLGNNYIPDLDAGDIIATIELEVGTNVDETERVAKKVEKIFNDEIPEMVSQYTIVGQSESNLLTGIGFKEGKNRATISAHLCLPQYRQRTAIEIAEVIRLRLAEIPEIENYQVIGGSMLQNMLLGNSKPVEIKISGKSFEKINETALYFVELLKSDQRFSNVESSIDLGKLEYVVDIDKDKASLMGLNTAMIALQIRNGIYGAEAGTYKEEGDDYKIVVRFGKDYRNSIEDLKKINLSTLMGSQVALSNVAEIKESYGPLEIKHETQSRFVTVGAELNGITLSEAAQIVREMISKTDADHAVNIAISGEVLDKEESYSNLQWIFIIGLVLVFMVMASQFESLKDPFIILFAIPFAIIGVVLAFVITGIQLNIVSFVGVIMLLGIVVNNGIVLVDYTNLLRARGWSITTAALDAGKSRLRPVLMTSLTTILAMIPMLFSKSMGSELWIPLAITMIGGLTVSLLITLYLIPCIYLSLNQKALKNEKNR
ncbi:MAG: efflux RND transporter permease subunit [Bacteroidales bacterium]|nr:efflux RND transporter permease subunit [Bacteroidales bacterium]HOY37966.1 efflux RND transporter permease subunit [Bacteroidales bacterium]HQP03177.1 efflux RND transporter permease subunit [Bacteroidales bacterium]